MSWRPLGPLAPNIISMGVLLLDCVGNGCRLLLVFQVAFKRCFRGLVLNGVCFVVVGVFRSCGY